MCAADFCCSSYSPAFDEYTALFGNLVTDLSDALNWPADLPVVIGETGNVEGGNNEAFWAAQQAVTQLPSLAGRSAFVPTHDYLYEGSQGPDSTHRHHWYGNALSYMQIGNAVAQALRGLQSTPAPCVVTTGGNAPAGSACDFPFMYQGQTFSQCTTLHNSGVPWCYTAQRTWGVCTASCPGGPPDSTTPFPSPSPPPPSPSPPSPSPPPPSPSPPPPSTVPLLSPSPSPLPLSSPPPTDGILTGTLGTCAAEFVDLSDVVSARAACTAACNANGFCCTNNAGGCQRMTCTAGCLLAWYANSRSDCEATCEEGDRAGCTYRHEPSGLEFFNCGGHAQCGCPADEGSDGFDPMALWGSSNDCGSGRGCKEGCRLAGTLTSHPFFGRELSAAEREDANAQRAGDIAVLGGALDTLSGHVTGQATMGADELARTLTMIIPRSNLLKADGALITKVFDLIDAFEASSHGPLFMSTGPFSREGRAGDGRETDRAMLAVQQTVIDSVYNGLRGLRYPKASIIAECSSGLFAGRGWQTASYYPGAVAASNANHADVTHAVSIDAFVPATWGVVTYWSQTYAQRPLGLYLIPGQVARVSVPPTMVGAGYVILVGAQNVDNSENGPPKAEHRRMDRVSVSFTITERVTHVANPLGGGLYVLVPYLADLGVVEVEVSGGVVLAPLFRRTHFDMMTNEDWRTRRTAPGPHADFETDKFLLNVPRSWTYAFDDPTEMLRQYDLAMDGTHEWLGYPRAARGRGVHTLYLQPDLHIKHGACLRIAAL